MRKLATVVAALAVTIGVAACGGDDSTSTADSMDHMDGSADDHTEGMVAESDHEESFAFGEPADAADADRTVEVAMHDDYTYDPDGVDVSVGETVEFQITNTGKVVHEFVIGDPELQQEHEEEMAGMEAGMMMAPEPNAVAVEPGGTGTLTFHFTEPADLTYACHQPGHFDAGMEAPLTVS